MASVSIAGPVYTVMMAIGTMLGGGGCVLIARTLGEKDDSKVKLYSSLCCWGEPSFRIAVYGSVSSKQQGSGRTVPERARSAGAGTGNDIPACAVRAVPGAVLYRVELSAGGGERVLSHISIHAAAGHLLSPVPVSPECGLCREGNMAAHVVADIGAAAVAVILALRQYRILKASET